MNATDAAPNGTTPNGMRQALPLDGTVIRRPHFHLKGDSLFFLISRRPFTVLSEAERLLWNALEQEASVSTLLDKLGASAEQDIRRLVALDVADVALPIPAAKRRRVMVVEPHMDDAALSVGGLMLQQRSEREFVIVTMATQSLATVYRSLDREYFDIATVSALRKAESGIVARLLWGRHLPLGLVEATLRYRPENWTLDWFRRHQDAIWMCLGHAPAPEVLELWTSTLAKAIADLQPDEIWMPLGVGVHVDHQITRYACLNVLRTQPELVERCVCRFFQDVPYAADFRAHTAALTQAIEGSGCKLEEERTDITSVMPEKMRVLGVYASQWKTPVIQVRVENCAKNVSGSPERYGELSYRVTSAPMADIDMLATSAMKDTIYRVAQDVAPWLQRNRSASTIGVLLAVPTGGWKQDMQFLLDCFPNARFNVYMQAKFAGEAETFSSPQITVRVGGDRWRWVFGHALPTIIGRKQPLVIISGREREKHGRWMARLGLLSDPVLAPTMSDFILALQYAAKKDSKLR